MRLITSRREFLAAGTAAALVAAGDSPVVRALSRFPEREAPRHPLRILILGGTSYLGPHQIAYAMSRGHSITTFTRGRTIPTVHQELFAHVEPLIGDREDDLESLKGKTWDVGIDNSGSRVPWTRDSANLLRDSADLYVYTSSTGAYYPYLGTDITEETPVVLAVSEGLSSGEAGAYDFGVMKANSEIEARNAYGDDRTIVVRPTFMLGPADTTNRFAHWPVRLSQGGEVLVPGGPLDPVQYIDVRDAAAWMIRLAEERAAGTFDAVGPASASRVLHFVHGAHAAFSSPATFIPVTDYDFLSEHRVRTVLPWIVPTGGYAGSSLANNQKGIGHGLSFTPLATTIRDVYEWWHSSAVLQERRDSVLSGERSLIVWELEILSAWRGRG